MKKATNVRYLNVSVETFFESNDPLVYSRVWFDAVQEHIYIVKNGINKDQFPLTDCVIYQQHEAEYLQQALAELPNEVGIKHVKDIHFIVKFFSGTICKETFDDPDPTRSHTDDSRFWRRLYYYARYTDGTEGFAEAVKLLREKGFMILPHQTENRLRLVKPKHVDQVELKSIIHRYTSPYDFKEAFSRIEDCKSDVLKRHAQEGVL